MSFNQKSPIKLGPIEQIKSEYSDLNKNEVMKIDSNKEFSSENPCSTRLGHRNGTKQKTFHPALYEFVKHSEEVKEPKPKIDPKSLSFVLLIDGKALDYALSAVANKKKLVMLLFSAKTVLFHSMSPDLKIKLVRLLKNNFCFKPSVLAVGDGYANAGMLREADIGINCADINTNVEYAPDIHITSFSQLSDFILTYGHYSKVRISKIILLTVYKEMMVGTILFLFQTQSYFSGTSLIDYDLIVFFELFVSFFPIFFVGIFYKDYDENKDLTSIYSAKFLKGYTNFSKIFMMYVNGVIQGIVIYVIVVYGSSFIISSNGFTEDSQTKGLIAYVLINLSLVQQIFIENLKFDFLNSKV